MRLIDKDELLKSLGIPEDMECCHCEWAYTYGGCTRDGLSDACFFIENAEEVERWIPCSERLPEKNQMVITTIVGTDVIRMGIGETFDDAVARVRKNVRVSVGYIEEDGWYGADGYQQIVAPIAWMPMPDPYMEAGYD